MATWPKILRLKRADKPSEHMLFNVATDGPNELDLKIVGTDQELLYCGSIKESTVNSLQASNFTSDLVEWKSVVAYILLRQCPGGHSKASLTEVLQGVEAVSAISGTTATITVRKNVGGITQKLGTVKLEQFQEDVDLFEWINAAVVDSDGLREDIETLQASVTSQQDQVTRLTSELDRLVKAKRAHEEEMVSKFAALLNTKKLKIRDQERLLREGRQVDAASANQVAHAIASGRSGRQAGPSRGSKRKAESTAAPNDEDTADEDPPTESGTMDEEDEEETRRQETPETDDDDELTADDLDEPGDRSGFATGHDDAQTTREVATQESQSTLHRMDVDTKESPPPKLRDLPARKTAAREPTPQPTSSGHGDNETENEAEDEL